ncbi:hypothetical protein [Streptomyces sp. YIM 130001]|uniref:hypothetical protein n=1 Tax=Streptomyces sp. YIM 130001 TaxID=2259644 RepID=UPI003204B6D5
MAMTGQQLPGAVGEFGEYLQGLVARLDAAAGWCGVFWQRDPDGMSACFEGREVPPWDVVESLIHDLAQNRGPAEAEQESIRARALHRSAVVAHDADEGARKLLGDRLDVMRDELSYAAGRQQELGALIHGAASEEAERLTLELAWARDDHERASARCVELQVRIGELDHRSTAAGAIAESAAEKVFTADAEGAHHWGDEEAEEEPRPDLPPAEIYRSVDVSAPRPGGAGGSPSGTGPGGGAVHGGSPQRASRFDDPLGVGETYADAPAATSDPGADGRDRGGALHGSRPGTPNAQYVATPRASAPGPGILTGDELLADSGVFTVPDMLTASRSPDLRSSDARTADESAGHPHAFPDTAPSWDEPVASGRPEARPRGARFAGLEADEASAPALPSPTGAAAVPRGARFAGATDDEARRREGGDQLGAMGKRPSQTPHETAEAHRATARTVTDLIRLRAEGRGGEAHAMLCEALDWPAARLPLLAAELHRAGLAADWATFLWEAASMPPEKLAAAAGALAAVGRAEDCRHLLRQGTARPAPEIAEAVLALDAVGRAPEADGLLDACIRARTPDDCAAIAVRDPARLVPRLLNAARDVSGEHHWDLIHALRVAGLTA